MWVFGFYVKTFGRKEHVERPSSPVQCQRELWQANGNRGASRTRFYTGHRGEQVLFRAPGRRTAHAATERRRRLDGGPFSWSAVRELWIMKKRLTSKTVTKHLQQLPVALFDE